MTMITAVVLYDMPQFNRNILMNQTARQIASTLRDAEQRSVSVSQRGGATVKNYGVYFDTAANSDFVLFNDADDNLKYDSSGVCDNECIANYSFTQGVHIKSLKKPDDNTLNGMHVIFYRPDPSIKISDESGMCVSGVLPCPVGGYGPFKITIESRDTSLTKTIDVWLTGQISIEP